jgi:hypothetical protein
MEVNSLRIEGEGKVHSIISRLEEKHGKCVGDFDLAVLEGEPLRFADGSILGVYEALNDNEEPIGDVYELDFNNPKTKILHGI